MGEQGGGTGLGRAALIAADIPLLFTINFRLIQQVGGAYGFSLRGPEFQPLILSIFNVASSGSPEAKADAMREMSVAGAAVGAGINYWFTTQTAETSYMLFRALYIERKERL